MVKSMPNRALFTLQFSNYNIDPQVKNTVMLGGKIGWPNRSRVPIDTMKTGLHHHHHHVGVHFQKSLSSLSSWKDSPSLVSSYASCTFMSNVSSASCILIRARQSLSFLAGTIPLSTIPSKPLWRLIWLKYLSCRDIVLFMNQYFVSCLDPVKCIYPLRSFSIGDSSV